MEVTSLTHIDLVEAIRLWLLEGGRRGNQAVSADGELGGYSCPAIDRGKLDNILQGSSRCGDQVCPIEENALREDKSDVDDLQSSESSRAEA